MSDAERERVRGLIHRFLHELGDGTTEVLDDTHDLFAGGALDSVAFVDLLTWLSDQTGRQIDFTAVDPGTLGRVGLLLDHFAGGRDH